MILVDSHCHFDLLDRDREGNEPLSVINRALQSDVHYFLNVCVDLQTVEAVLNVAEQHECVFASVGVHPNHHEDPVTREQLLKYASLKKVIAIGETGLDYYRSKEQVSWQQDQFRLHIDLAKSLRKPLIIHTREAQQDTLRIMKEQQAYEIGGVMHCFTENWDMAKAALDLGFYISISGIVTFKNAKTVQEVAKQVPLDRLLIETDSPYLAPEPMRGQPNEPAFVRHTAAYLAALRQVSLEEIAEQTTNNFFNLFKGAHRSHV